MKKRYIILLTSFLIIILPVIYDRYLVSDFIKDFREANKHNNLCGFDLTHVAAKYLPIGISREHAYKTLSSSGFTFIHNGMVSQNSPKIWHTLIQAERYTYISDYTTMYWIALSFNEDKLYNIDFYLKCPKW